MIHSIVQEAIVAGLEEKLFSACALGIQPFGKDPGFFTVGKNSLSKDAKTIDHHSLFDIASITKVVYTTTLATQAYEKKLLKLEDKLKKWIPDSFYQYYSIEDLLLHQAKFRPRLRFHLACPELHQNFKNDLAISKRLMQAISVSGISTAPHKVVYSDPGFILLAEILCSMFNTSANDSWMEQIQQPMKLYSTKIPSQISSDDVVVVADMDLQRGEIHDPDARYIGRLCGHAGLFSSIEDMVSFGNIWLEDYLGKKKRFHQETVQRFIDPYMQSHERVLGWDKPSAHSTAGNISPRSIGHLGFTGTSIWIDFEKKITVSLLTNRTIMGIGNNEAELKAKTAVFNDFRRKIHNLIWETC